jgi:outer membrane protein assembly factor BamD (BamD/ComL family)
MAQSRWIRNIAALAVLAAFASNTLAIQEPSQAQSDYHLKNEEVKTDPVADALYKQVVTAVDQHRYSDAIALLEKLANMKITEAYVDLGNFYVMKRPIDPATRQGC